MFLLSKRERYFWDAEAVREENVTIGDKREGKGRHSYDGKWNGEGKEQQAFVTIDPAGRNIRSVWTITPKPFKGAHFATFPPALVERCVKAGTSERGACPSCGKPWERVTEGPTSTNQDKPNRGRIYTDQSGKKERGAVATWSGQEFNEWRRLNPIKTLGFRPACTCHGHFVTIDDDPDNLYARPRKVYVPDGPQPDPVPCVVLDPFSGAGTVAMVAKQLGRDAIGIDLNPTYNRMARKRIAAV